jgi:hypothetical protein
VEAGKLYNTRELQEHFDVTGFMAPYVVVKWTSDGQKGSLMFLHSPRYCFGFEPHSGNWPSSVVDCFVSNMMSVVVPVVGGYRLFLLHTAVLKPKPFLATGYHDKHPTRIAYYAAHIGQALGHLLSQGHSLD